MTALFIGVDPGANGGIVIIDEQATVLRAERMPETDADIRDLLRWPSIEMPLLPCRAVIEHVTSSPQMGVKSAFSFGGSYRAAKMALTCCHIPYDEVTPRRWQRALECLSGGEKDVLRERAQQLFPGVKITYAIADALLLAEYGRRQAGHAAKEAEREAGEPLGL